ncbi:MAG: ferritin [Candidatus Atribacteria bacterium]|nr:ferritin [Candidatus Atribacteria bacterium]MCD6350038.1 ferritin [Candidatus Atribacteria bacterium]
MLSKKLEDALNEQIKNELYSAYLYLAMAAQCEAQNLNGFAHWLKVQAKEEISHGMKIYDFVNDRGGRVILKAIEQPPVEFGTPLDMFKKVLEHEQKVTSMINQLYQLAKEENDYPAQVMLQWFINEQVEEEKNASYILGILNYTEGKGQGLLMLDRELGKREA